MMTGADFDKRLDPLFRLSNSVVDDEFASKAIADAKLALKGMHETIIQNQPSSVENFLIARRLPKTFLSCAACGMRQEESNFRKAPFSLDQLSLFKFEEGVDDATLHRIQEAGRDGAVFSFYQRSNGDMMHLHPEFVDNDSAIICNSCGTHVDQWNQLEKTLKSNSVLRRIEIVKARPLRSIAGGRDFGLLRRHPDFAEHFSTLTVFDWMALSSVRTYGHVLKVSNGHTNSSGPLRGNLISFDQDHVWEDDALSFIDNKLHQRISLVLMGSRKQFEARMRHMLPFGRIFDIAPNKFDTLMRAARVFKALGCSQFSNVLSKTEEEAPENAHAVSVLKNYFDGDRDQPGSILNYIYHSASVKDDEEVLDVDSVANNSDPARAQLQTFREKGDVDFSDELSEKEIIYETNFISASNGPGQSFYEQGDAVTPAVLLGANNIFFPENTATNAMRNESQQETEEAEQEEDEERKLKNAESLETSAAGENSAKSIKIPIARRATPLNDYSETNKLITGLMPQFFPLAQGPSTGGGPLNKNDRRHIMLQFDSNSSNHPLFLPLVFNQNQKAAYSSHLKTAVKNNSKAFLEFKTLQNDPSFEQSLKNAIANPGSKDSKALTLRLSKVLRVFHTMLPNSPQARRQKLGDFMSFSRFFGMWSQFITHSPDPIGDPNSLRRTFPVFNNHLEFPNVDDGFTDALIEKREWSFQDQDGKEAKTNLTLGNLMKLANGFPTVFAEDYRLDEEAIYHLLIGLPIANTTCRGSPMPIHACSGKTWNICGVNEDTGKGWSHLHLLTNSGNSSNQF